MGLVFKQLMPEPVRSAWRAGREFFHHTYTRRRLFGARAGFIPPLRLMHDGPVGYREFKENGEEFFRHYVELCGLKPDEDILDIGCGIGRKTLPLIDYLSERGSYTGLDIVKSGVDWCTAKYTSRYPNFRFQLSDVYNHLYHPEGKHKASDYQFPFADNQFDFAVLNSVFTHMMPGDMENYLGEVSRVLRPGGRCLISFFLLNPESLGLVETKQSTLDFRYEYGPVRTVSQETLELATAYEESYVTDLYRKHGLEIRPPVLYGSWCGRQNFFSYQDQVLAFKA